MQRLEGVVRKQPLIGEIVDGEHGCRAHGIRGKQRRHQTGLPVMRMHDLRLPGKPGRAACDGDRDLAKQREARGVVVPGVAMGIEVGIAGAIVGRRKVDEPDLDARTREPALQQRHRLRQRGTVSCATFFSRPARCKAS